MIELTLDEMKQMQLNILKEFVKYCDTNNLRYFLGYGTLLGAVRHKGFIPWDDDIDVIMPRPDYEKFIHNFNKKDFEVFEPSIDRDFYLPFAKLSDKRTKMKEICEIKFEKLGVNIDIFPLDGVSDNKNKNKFLIKKISFLRGIFDLKNISVVRKRNLYKNIILIFGKIIFYPINYRAILNKITNDAKNIKYQDSQKVGCLVWNYGFREIMDKEIFDKNIKLEFENVLYDAPHDYDKYLKNLYGDYMKLPPEDKRVAHHTFKAYKK